MDRTKNGDPTLSGEETIALAYQAMRYTPSQESFRRGLQKKTYNPIHTAPVFNRVVTHLDLTQDMDWARKRTREIVREEAAAAYIAQLSTPAMLRAFLATLSLFLDTTATKERKEMQTFEPKRDQRLAPDQVVKRAYELSRRFPWLATYNLNKMTKLVGRIHGARGKWECLAVLAQYYALRGVNQALINQLVKELEEVQMGSFQELVNQLLVFYSAAAVKTTQANGVSV